MAHTTKLRSHTGLGLLTKAKAPPITPVPWVRSPSTVAEERLSDPLAVEQAPAHRSYVRGVALVMFVVASSVGLWGTLALLGYRALRG